METQTFQGWNQLWLCYVTLCVGKKNILLHKFFWVSLGYDYNKVGEFVESITTIVIRGLSWVNFKTLSWQPENDL